MVQRGDVLCDGATCPNLLEIDLKEEWHRRPHRQRRGGDCIRYNKRANNQMPARLVEYLAGLDHETEVDSSGGADSSADDSADAVPSSCSRVWTATTPQSSWLRTAGAPAERAQKPVKLHPSVDGAVGGRARAAHRARAKWQPKTQTYQLAKSTWRRTAAQLATARDLQPNPTVKERLAAEGVPVTTDLLPPPSPVPSCCCCERTRLIPHTSRQG